jgi:biopolymer transport protein ExbB
MLLSQGLLAFLFQAQQKGIVEYVANILVEKYIQGGFFMHPILAILIIGIGLSIAKWISLSRASINTRKFLAEVKAALDEGGIDKALEVCQKTPGPVASIFQAGLLRANEGIEAAEKAIISYGGIEMAFLERGLVWLSLFISLAPLLGFTGTVQGMIVAFDSIKEAKNISPEIVAGGISIALLTTLFGLVSAIILQTFYNYFVAKVDKIVIDMEESSIELIDALAAMQQGKKVSVTETKNTAK